MQRFAFLLIVAGALAGCGGDPNPPQVTTDSPDYEAQQNMFSSEIWGPVVMNAGVGQWANVKTALTSPNFLKTFEAFEKEPLPSKASTPERETARTDLIKNIKDAIEGAKSGGSDADLKTNIDSARENLQKMQKPLK